MEDQLFLLLTFAISSANVFGNVANIIYTIGSSIRNSFYLRFAIVFGAIFEILYSSLIVDEPLWTPIIWAIIIICVNVYFITVVYIEKYSVQLNPDELRIYNNLFSRMDKMIFQKFMKMGSNREYAAQRDLIQEGKISDRLFLLNNGVAEVIVNESAVAYVHSGGFIGEMSFLTGDLPTATVRTMVASKIYSWNKVDINRMSEKNSTFKTELQSILSGDLIHKITNQNKKESKFKH